MSKANKTEAAKNTNKATEAAKPKKVRKPKLLTLAGTVPVHQRTHGVGGVLFAGSVIKVDAKAAKAAVKSLKKEASGETGVSKAANGQVRLMWRGHSLASLLRWMGSQGASPSMAGEWMAAIGFPGVNAITLTAQVSSGRCGKREPKTYTYGIGGPRGAVAELSGEESKMLKAIRPANDDESEDGEAE